jgi:F-type H+-transporting ATPase subunit b
MMASLKNRRQILYYAALFFLLLFMNAPEAFASEQEAGWRPTYDLVMRWVNFSILVFILVKYLKNPIKEFLYGQKAIIARQIGKLEEEKEKTIEKISGTKKMLADSDSRLADLKERMVRQGKKEKEQIIEAAKQQSHFMLEGAKRKVENRIQQAKANFRSEMVDLAVNAAIQQLPSQVTEEDNQKFVTKFLKDAQTTSS